MDRGISHRSAGQPAHCNPQYVGLVLGALDIAANKQAIPCLPGTHILLRETVSQKQTKKYKNAEVNCLSRGVREQK